MKKLFVLLMLAAIVGVVAAATPGAVENVQKNDGSTWPEPTPASADVNNSYIYDVNMSGHIQTKLWSAIGGQLDFTYWIADSDSDWVKQWQIIPSGYIYALQTSTAPDWDALQVVTAASFDTAAGWSATWSDNAANTYNDGTEDVTLAGTAYSTVPYVVLNGNNTTGIKNYLLATTATPAATTDFVFVGEVHNDMNSYKGDTYKVDYQLLLPITDADGSDDHERERGDVQTTYYFWVELE